MMIVLMEEKCASTHGLAGVVALHDGRDQDFVKMPDAWLKRQCCINARKA